MAKFGNISKLIYFNDLKITCLEINLTNDGKDLCHENYKATLRQIKQNLYKWKDILSLWIRRINIVKMMVNSSQFHLQIQCNPNHNSNRFFFCQCMVELNSDSQISVWQFKGLTISNVILKNKRIEGCTLPDFRTHYKATVIKTEWYW